MRLSTSNRAARKLDAAFVRVERKRIRLAARPDEAGAADLRKNLMRLWTMGSCELVGDLTAAKALYARLQTLLEECRRTVAGVSKEFVNALDTLERDFALYFSRLEAWCEGGPMALARAQVFGKV